MISSAPKRSRPAETVIRRDDAPPLLTILRIEPVALRHYRRNLGLRSDRAALVALAGAVAASPGWPAESRIALVVKAEPDPVIGILCEQGAVDPGWLSAQARVFGTAVERLRYVSSRQAEQAVAQLADRLVSRFGPQELRSFRFAAIPRGGLIVMGMLASMLDLPSAQVAAATPSGEPLVVVDDCALSGARFGAFLAGRPERQGVFAHLFSHPELRSAIEAREPRVLACLAARDLHDHGPERLAAGYAAALARWEERLGHSRYWIGDCDRICFPWNEPDRLVWNPTAKEVETGWKLVPSSHCFKGSSGGASPKRSIRVQARGRGPLRPSPGVLFTRWNGETLVARLDGGEVFRLSGSAAGIWWTLVATGDVAAAHRALVRRYRADSETLLADLSGFCAVLLKRELIQNETTFLTLS